MSILVRGRVVVLMALAVMTLIAALAASATTTTTVVHSGNLGTPSNPNSGTGWFFYNDETDVVDNTLGSFVAGPGTTPLGQGSAQITVSGTQRRNLATYQFSGTPLADITTLRFSTYNPLAGNGDGAGSSRSAYLNFNVDFSGSDTWQRRLVFVPRQNGTVLQDTWQEWDAINGGNALWSYSGPTWPVTGEPGTTLKTWGTIVAQYPGIRIRVTDSWLGIRVGEPYPNGYTENVDAFKFGTLTGGDKVFDFDPAIGPASDKDQCKNGGWQSFNNPPYKNQGDCVSSVVSKGKNN